MIARADTSGEQKAEARREMKREREKKGNGNATIVRSGDGGAGISGALSVGGCVDTRDNLAAQSNSTTQESRRRALRP